MPHWANLWISSHYLVVASLCSALKRTQRSLASGDEPRELVDGDFENPVVLGTFAAPIGVEVALPVGTPQGYPSGQLCVVDGSLTRVTNSL